MSKSEYGWYRCDGCNEIKLSKAHFIGRLQVKHFCFDCWEDSHAVVIAPPSEDEWEEKMALERQRTTINSIYHLREQLPKEEWSKFKSTITRSLSHDLKEES